MKRGPFAPPTTAPDPRSGRWQRRCARPRLPLRRARVRGVDGPFVALGPRASHAGAASTNHRDGIRSRCGSLPGLGSAERRTARTPLDRSGNFVPKDGDLLVVSHAWNRRSARVDVEPGRGRRDDDRRPLENHTFGPSAGSATRICDRRIRGRPREICLWLGGRRLTASSFATSRAPGGPSVDRDLLLGGVACDRSRDSDTPDEHEDSCRHRPDSCWNGRVAMRSARYSSSASAVTSTSGPTLVSARRSRPRRRWWLNAPATTDRRRYALGSSTWPHRRCAPGEGVLADVGRHLG